MRNLKKAVALLVVLAMMLSSVSFVFAADATTTATAAKTDAEIAQAIGMIEGTGTGVTAEYLAKTPTKIQMAYMVLKLKGLKDEAMAFTGTDNFKDASTSAGDEKVMAYLKANPGLGMIGYEGNFEPTALVTAQMYYKVMLEALGYKQGTDFEWDNVFAFAETKGLSKVAKATTFTIDNISSATVEALKANVKGGTKTLVATLVDAGKVNAAKAAEVGLVAAAATVAPTAAATATPAVTAATYMSISAVVANNVNNGTTMELTQLIPANSTLKVTFSEKVKGTGETSPNANTVKLVRVDNNVPAGIIMALNTDGNALTVTPTSALTKGKQYKLVVDAKIASNADAAKTLGTTTEYTFTVSNDGVLTATPVYAGNDAYDGALAQYAAVAKNSDIKMRTVADDAYFAAQANAYFYVNFDSFLDASNLSAAVKVKNVTDGTFVNIQAVVIGGDVTATNATANKTVRIKILEALTASKKYAIEVTGAKTANGGDITAVSYPFLAGSTLPTVSVIQTVDGTKLTDTNNQPTTASSPAYVNGKQTAVTLSNSIPKAALALVVGFSSVTDNATVTDAAFKLVKDSDASVIACDFSYDASLKQARITPKTDLEEGTLYKFTVSNGSTIKNTLGGAMPAVNYYVKTFDATAPSVLNVEGSVTNLPINQASTFKVNFSEPIGYARYIANVLTSTDNVPNVASKDTSKLDATHGITVIEAGKTATSVNADLTAQVSRSTDKKSLTISVTPTDRAKTYQIIIGGSNSANEQIVDVGVGVGTKTDLAFNPMASNYIITFTTEPADTATPVVTGVKKVDSTGLVLGADLVAGAKSIATTQIIAVCFNEDMNNDTLKGDNDGTIATGEGVALYNMSSSANVNISAATHVYSANSLYDYVVVNPAEILGGLAADTNYKLTITTQAKDATGANGGNAIAATYEYLFTTGAAPDVANVFWFKDANSDNKVATYEYATNVTAETYGPLANSTSVLKDSKIVVGFKENVTGISSTTVKLKDSTGTEVPNTTIYTTMNADANATAIANTSLNDDFVLIPGANLTAGASYTLELTAGITDLVGNPLGAKSYIFRVLDDAAPTVASVTPADNTFDVACDSNLTVVFNKPMNANTIDSAITGSASGIGNTIRLYVDHNKDGVITNVYGTETVAAEIVPITVTYDTDKLTATITPNTMLKAGYTYKLAIGTGIKGMNGTAISAVHKTFVTSTVSKTPAIVSAIYNSTSKMLIITLNKATTRGAFTDSTDAGAVAGDSLQDADITMIAGTGTVSATTGAASLSADGKKITIIYDSTTTPSIAPGVTQIVLGASYTAAAQDGSGVATSFSTEPYTVQ